MIHTHDCSLCPARFDCDEEPVNGFCPLDMCRRCRERLHASENTADLMPIDFYEIQNATEMHSNAIHCRRDANAAAKRGW